MKPDKTDWKQEYKDLNVLYMEMYESTMCLSQKVRFYKCAIILIVIGFIVFIEIFK